MTPIRVALIGFGYWGRILAKEITRNSNFELTSIWDPNLSFELLPQEIGNNVELKKSDKFSEVTEMAVIVATPASTHFEIVSKMLQMGKSVLCEKPITTNTSDSSKLQKIARNGVLQIGQTYLYHPVFNSIKSEIKSYGKSKNSFLYSNRIANGPIRHDVAAHWDLAAHDLSILMFLTDSKINRVLAFSNQQKHNKLIESLTILCEMENENLGSINVSWGGAGKNRIFHYIDDELSISYDEVTSPYSHTINYRTLKSQQVKELIGDSMNSPLQCELTDFAFSVRERWVDPEKLAIGFNVVSVLDAIDDSLKQGLIWKEVSYETD